jgi:putative alpha-1,2-mannosidase
MGTLPGAADFGTGGGAGNTFPGATTPFGLVAFSPDTFPGAGTLSTYSHDSPRLRGFSLTHFSGAGCLLYGDVPLLPTTAALTASPLAGDGVRPELLPRMDHRTERASPGSYSVRAGAVRSELTATPRTGVARFTFPRGARRSVLVNAGGSINRNTAVRLAIDPARREVSGMVESGRFCASPTHYRVYFSARFDRSFRAHGTWSGPELRKRSRSVSADSGAGAYVTLGGRGRSVEARVGVSFVSVAGRAPTWRRPADAASRRCAPARAAPGRGRSAA